MNKSTKINEELRPDELEKAATDLAYSMPNHTKYDDKKGPTDAQIVKAMKKYFKDLYQHSTISQKKQAIKIVKNVLSEGKLNEISTGAGLNDVIQGRTSSIEGYTLSKELADKILTLYEQYYLHKYKTYDNASSFGADVLTWCKKIQRRKGE